MIALLRNNPNLAGIMAAMGASIFFSLNDMSIKFLSGDYALHQVVLTRSIFGLVFTLAIFVPLEGGLSVLRTQRFGSHMLRGAFVVTANMTFFLSLAALPIAEVTAVFFISPILITALSVVLLGERVGPRRWIAVALGLLGVIVMLRPGSGVLHPAAFLPLLAALCYALLHMMTRKIGGTERASTMAFYIQLTFIIVSAAIGLFLGDGRFAGTGDPSLEFLFRQWIIPPIGDFTIMALIGIGSAFGGYLISQAYRMCEAGLAAPFEYVAMPLAILWGVLIWGDWPDATAWVGIALIIGAGLFIAIREGWEGRKRVGVPARR